MALNRLLRFLSTLSLRRATVTVLGIQHKVGISIHALLAESDKPVSGADEFCMISIHALLAESDPGHPAPCRSAPSISIHALLAESDTDGSTTINLFEQFLSTLSLRRATLPSRWSLTPRPNFYPRSPCGERPARIRSLSRRARFLSTLSLRRATAGAGDGPGHICDFYPRSPCGERLLAKWKKHKAPEISIHALLAESDDMWRLVAMRLDISIHALLAESD